MSKFPRFKTPYNHDPDLPSFSSGLDCSNDPGQTVQSEKDSTDINKLVETFYRTGVIPGQDFPVHEFDAGDITDYHSALNALIEADSAFLKLPSYLREYFHNDPGEMLSFLGDESNRPQAIELGLVPPPPQAPPELPPVPENPQSVNPQSAAPLSDS